MIRIGILDISGEGEGFFCEALKSSLFAVDTKIKNEKRRAESILARLLLKEMYKEFSPLALPMISIGENGKPYFTYSGENFVENGEEPHTRVENNEDARIFFNISHDSSLIAVAMSDSAEVGIDIQSIGENMCSREKIEQRLFFALRESDFYFSRAGADEDLGDVKIKRYRIEKDSEQCLIKPDVQISLFSSDEVDLADADMEFLFSWTNLEALMKMSGEGFSAVNKITQLLSRAKISSGFLRDDAGKVYCLTVAQERN